MKDWTKNRMPDRQILRALLENEGITEEERKAFADMEGRLEARPAGAQLTDRQRQWAVATFVRLGLADESGSENLASSGAVVVTDVDRASMDAWTRSLGPRPLKPPWKR